MKNSASVIAVGLMATIAKAPERALHQERPAVLEAPPRRRRKIRWGDVGLKALGMDHGTPAIDGARVWFCSDEHVTFAPAGDRPIVGSRVRVVPAHVDPTMAMHEVAWLVDGDLYVWTPQNDWRNVSRGRRRRK